jgi:hypothetical protein
MRPSVRMALAAAVALPFLATSAAGAGAAPSNATLLTIRCGTTTYQAWIEDRGPWPTAHDLASTSSLIPMGFGDATITIYDPSGTVVDSFVDAGRAKGQSANAVGEQWCTFVLDETDQDGFRFVVTGAVLGKITPTG